MGERAAARVGVAAKLQRLALAQIDTATLPAVLVLQGNKACVLMAVAPDRSEYRVLLPETGLGYELGLVHETTDTGAWHWRNEGTAYVQLV